MRVILGLLLSLVTAAAVAQTNPVGPCMQGKPCNMSGGAISGNLTVGGTLGVTGATTLSGGGTLSGTFTSSGATLSGTFAGAHTYSGKLTLNGGIAFTSNVNAFSPGNFAKDANWGWWIEGNSGAQADLALASSNGTAALRIQPAASGSWTNITKGLALAAGGGTGPNSITWSGSTQLPPNLNFLSWGDWGGTVSPSSGDIGLNEIFVDHDNLVHASGSIDGLLVQHNVRSTGGSSSAQGDRVGIYAQLFQRQQTATSGGASFIALGSWGKTFASEGGTSLTQSGAAGALWAATFVSEMSSASPFFRGQDGLEVDMITNPSAGQGPLARWGINIVNQQSTTGGYTIDNAYSAGASNNATAGWAGFGYAIGYSSSQFVMDPTTGIGFGVDASQPAGVFSATSNTMAWLLDGRNGTYNGGQLRLRGFRVGALGEVQSGPLQISYSGGTSTIDTSRFVGPADGATFSGGTITSGGTGVLAGMRYEDSWGGVYVVNTVSGGHAATLITVYTQPSDSSNHSGSVTLTPDNTAIADGAGGTVTVTQTWTAGTTMDIGTNAATTVNVGNASSLTSIVGKLQTGSAALTLTANAIGVTKMTASASAPGAAGGKLELVCGTGAGTAKLVIYAGTSSTASTVVDNVGGGVTGC